MMKCRLIPLGAVVLLPLLLLVGCAPAVESESSLPPADAPLESIWAYAAGLRVEAYAEQRFGDLSDGLRRANQEQRIEFFSTGRMRGRTADLQCYLFFEHRRRSALPASTPLDPETLRYVRALVDVLNDY